MDRMKLELLKTIGRLRLNKKYIYYSLAIGLSSLIIPLGVQFLVNSLALNGMWFNNFTFLILIGLGLAVAHVIRHSQLILIELLQRDIFVLEMDRWVGFKDSKHAQYYFEVMNLLKSFSKSYAHLIELVLLCVFGLTTVILFHPAFIILPLILGALFFRLRDSFALAIKTSIIESNVKYRMYDLIQAQTAVSDDDIDDYLEAREAHFKFTKKNSVTVATGVLLCQLLLLGIGIYFIQLNQISVGQLVSMEIIFSGISLSLLKLPQTLEAIFDYETSEYKIKKTLAGGFHD